ncbi:MAG TPA: prepilin peptidase [Elusimicrobiota bacterium]|nr:prepilin peptidase [Elusimicrobiota bacterium]
MLLFLWILLALILGSFANVCIHRLPRGESIFWPPSRCPSCGKNIRWWQNVPLLSFLLLRGRCAACQKPIAWRYPLVEFLTALLFLALFLRFPERAVPLWIGATLSLLLLILTFIDLEHQIIPDALSLAFLVGGLAAFPVNPLLGSTVLLRGLTALTGAATGLALLWGIALVGKMVWHKEAMGGGDIKFMAALGTLLGWKGILFSLFTGSLLGSVWIGLTFWKRRPGEYLPFGPFLAMGAWLCWYLYAGNGIPWPLLKTF